MKFFKYQEFDDPTQPGSGLQMDAGFLALLDRARELAGIAFKVNSGYRTPGHNAVVGGKANSAHLKGKAADIEAATGREKFLIVGSALAAGIKRVGIGSTFVHLDCDDELPHPTIWTYSY